MKRRNFLAGSILALGGSSGLDLSLGLLSPGKAWAQTSGSKPATSFTKAANKAIQDSLPFNDRSDFEDAQRGFIATLDEIKDDNGKVVFSPKDFSIALDAPAPEFWNPSLWRVSQLTGLSGLFKVVDRLYQIRSFDVANLTIIEGDTGLIVMDPTTSTIAAKAALDLYFQHRPRKPVTAVIYTHSHIDHFGGVGAVTTAEEVAAGKTKVIAPAGFTEEAVSENLYAGNAMVRRSSYQYAFVLKRGQGADQSLGSGLGIPGPDAPTTLILPTDWVTETGQKMTIDGLEFEFLMAPGSEAPSEMHFYIPALKALCTAENATHTLHNFYTLRGAKTRDTAKWVKYLNETLDMWGDQAEVLYAPHQWPVWGNSKIRTHIEKYRDAFKFIHDRSLHFANAGYTMPEIGDMVQLPPELANNWATRGYYGSVSHDARAVYNFYLGYFSGNPAELNPLPPSKSAAKYVDLMGGSDVILTKARQAYDAGEYRWVAELLLHLVYAQPTNQAARNLQADAFEQLAYQSEAATWRNFYTVGAKELREGVPNITIGVGASPDLIRNTPFDMVLEYLGIAIDSDRAAGKTITINFEVDSKENHTLTLKNGVLNATSKPAANPDVTLRGEAASLNLLLMGGDPLGTLQSGKVTATGRKEAVTDLLALVTNFEFWFPIITRPAMT